MLCKALMASVFILASCGPGQDGADPTLLPAPAPATPSSSASPTSSSSVIGSTTITNSATATSIAARCNADETGVGASPALNLPYASVAGVEANLTSLDMYPADAPCASPVVLWVHGGGYAVGDKSNAIADKVRLFNDAGWTLVSINYRLTTGRAGSAVYPDHYNDLAAAIEWVESNIADYGGDPERIAVLGHSAGADIVSNVVTNPAYLAGVGMTLSDIVCAGPLDTEGFDKVPSGTNDPDGEKAQWAAALGNNPDYLTATSATLLVRSGIGIPPMIGVVRGSPERRSIEAAFLDRLAGHGIAATTIDASALSHAQVARNIGDPSDMVMTPPLMEFLTDCFSV